MAEDDSQFGTPLPPDFIAEGNPTLQQLIDYGVEKFHEPELLKKRQAAVAAGHAAGEAAAHVATMQPFSGAVRASVEKALEIAATALIGVTDVSEAILSPITRGAINSLLKDGDSEHGVSNAGELLLAKLTGSKSSVEPGIEGAARFMSLFLNESMEAVLRAAAVEFLTELGPARLAGIFGGVETLQKMQEVIEHALGGDRMVRRVLQPFISATAITPAQWHVNKKFRPELLGTGDAIRHYLRGRWTIERLREELARQGWSDDRIEALISNATKRLTIDQLIYLQQRGALSDAEVTDAARDLGYDTATAAALIQIENTQRLDRAKAPIVDAAVDAYLAGAIGDAELDRLVSASAPTQADAVYITSAAKSRRQLLQRPLSSTDERRLVLGGIRAVSDYRRALERENRTPEAVAALELELRAEMDDQRDVARAKAHQAADRAAAVAAAAADKAQREAEIEARKALPTLQEYRRAYVHGLITREQLSAALVREKVAIAGDDLAFLLADADADRSQYLADQDRRTVAIAGADSPRLSVATLEQAVLADILTIGEFDARLAQNHLPAGDRQILVALLQARIDARDEAEAQRAAATARAAAAGVSLASWERAVRLGVRTIDQYAAWLASIQTSDVGQALILDSLRAQLAADADARSKRGALDQAGAANGLSLAQRRRAYIAGIRPRDYYADALTAAGWPIADRDTELALADAEAAAADEARARRDAIADETAGPGVTLGQMERAVKLNLATPDELRDFLAARGYGADDIELIVGLVVADVPDVRAGQQLESRVARELAAKGITLADRKALVRRGLWTIDQYATAITSDGYSADDGALLAQLLAEEIAVDFDGLSAKVAKALGAADDAPTLDAILAAFDAGELDAAGVRDALLLFNVPRDSAIVFARLLPTFRSQG